MSEKNYKPLLIIGIVAIVAAMTGIYLLEPPSQAETALPSETPSQFETVLTPEDLAKASRPATATVSVARAAGFPSASPRPSGITMTASSQRTTARPTASVSAPASRTARRSPDTGATRSVSPRTPAPAATRRPAASANGIQPQTSPIPTESVLPIDPPEGPEASASVSGDATVEPPPAAEASPNPVPVETESQAGMQRSAFPASVSSRRGAAPGQTAASSAPVVSRGGGLLAAADSKYSITADGVEEAGGMKLIEGFRANGQAVLRDIRNTLLASSSLVKASRNGEELGGFETIGTGPV